MPFFLILLPFAVILPAIVAIFMRRKYGYGVPRLTEPHCAKCGYDLRRYTAEPPTRCSECGSDLTAPHAVRWGEMSRPRGVMLLPAVGMLVAALLLFGVVKRASIRPGPLVGPAALPSASNQALLASLPQTVQQPWTWQELDRRLLSGALSNSETASAIDSLIADLNTRNQPQPLVWSEQFVTHAITRGAIGNSQYTRLAQAFHGTASLEMATKVRQGKRLAFTIEYGSPWPLPGVVLLKSLRPVKLSDGTEIQTAALTDPNNGRGIPNPDYLSGSGAQSIAGNLKIDLPPGQYVANFILDAGECVQSGSQIIGTGQPAHWPSPVRSRWTEQIAAHFEVVPANQSPVVLVTDSALDPQHTGKITVTTLRAIHFASGLRIIAELSVDATTLACCFDVAARVNGEEHPLGILFASHGTATFNGQCNLSTLSPGVQSVDLIFRPDPTRAEGAVRMDRIWGRKIELLNLPLQRYDVEVQSPTTQ